MKINKYQYVILALAAVGVGQLGQGAYIHAKAILAQHLITSSWESAIVNDTQVKPWSWADTWPVSRLLMPKHQVDLIILAGDNGRTLAFGPGHRFGTVEPGTIGNSIISAHRDTHFRFLENIVIGEEFTIQTRTGAIQRYRITHTEIADARTATIPTQFDTAVLTFVTCYPFNTITPGGPLRYLVFSERIPAGNWL